MFVGFDRFRRRGTFGVADTAVSPAAASPPDEPPASASDQTSIPPDVIGTAVPERSSRASGGDPLPEQPIPLQPIPSPRRAKVGVVLPARRSLLPALPVPKVPKRAIFAVGICAGLAAPSLTRHLATRAMAAALGTGVQAATSTAAWESATVEIIRVTFASPQRGGATAAVGKILEQLRR